jgi:thymidine kinase
MEGMGQPIPKWILCDESQFFTEEHINQLAKIVDILDINVMCYGLRNDFTGHLFEGSKRLFELADNIEEIKLSCKCGKKAIINARIDEYGSILREGEQILIGGNESYKSMCRQCFFKNKDENEMI